MQQEINTLLLKGINLFGDLHHTGTLLEIQAKPDLNIVKSCSGELSWILNTYFKTKLPSSEIKPRLNISDAPKATCTSFSSCFLGKQTGNSHQTGNFATFRLPTGKGGRRTPVPPEGNTCRKSCREMPRFPAAMCFRGVTRHPCLEFPGSHPKFVFYKNI